MSPSRSWAADRDFNLAGNMGDGLSPVWSAWLATLELLTGLLFLFSPAIAAGDLAAAADINLGRAAEFVVGMLGVVLATIVRNRTSGDDEHPERPAVI